MSCCGFPLHVRNSSTPRPHGFTLIELLTVIAIIAILMGLLFPALNSAKTSSRKAQARSDETSLVTACMAYNRDYGVYPLNSTNANSGSPAGGGWDTCYGDPGPHRLYSSADLCNILRAVADTAWNTNNQLNTRQVVYFEPNIARNATNPRGGLVTASNGVTGPAGNQIPYGAFVDPWGEEYIVFLDANYDGSLSIPPPNEPYTEAAAYWFYSNSPPNSINVNSGVAAVSLGADLQWGTAGNSIFQGSDDIASWQ